MLYQGRERSWHGAPRQGERGNVVSLPVGGGRRATCMKGPGGGLVYVAWDAGSTMGVSSRDIDRVTKR